MSSNDFISKTQLGGRKIEDHQKVAINANLEIARYRYLLPNIKLNHTLLQDEVRRRTQVGVWAYAKTLHDVWMVSESKFIEVSESIDSEIEVPSANEHMFGDMFLDAYKPRSTYWIRNYPMKAHLEMYFRIWDKFKSPFKLVVDNTG